MRDILLAILFIPPLGVIMLLGGAIGLFIDAASWIESQLRRAWDKTLDSYMSFFQ